MPKTVEIVEKVPRKKRRQPTAQSQQTVFKPVRTPRAKIQILQRQFAPRVKAVKKVDALADDTIKRAYRNSNERDIKQMVYLRFGNHEGTGDPITSF